jgi:hypothetical protein
VQGAQGYGLHVGHADNDGVYVKSTSASGVKVSSANQSAFYGHDIEGDGVYIWNAGSPSSCQSSAHNNGFEVAGAESYGLYVGHSDMSGVYISYTDSYGVFVHHTDVDGICVEEATGYGVLANTTDANGEWGIITPDKIYGSNLTSRTQSTHVRNTGSESLEAGDIVCISGYEENTLDDGKTLVKVEKANSRNSTAVFGVVEYKVTIHEKAGEEHTLKSFKHADGSIGSGDYLSVIVFGPANVKVGGNASITTGEKLTVSENNGKTRSISENDNWTIGILGKALENSNGKDTVKVFVNCK